MRLLLAALIASIAGPAAAVSIPAPDSPAAPTQVRHECPRTTSVYAFQTDKSVKPRKLTELPDANAYSAVLRRIGGCEVPVIVRYGVGSGR